MVSEIPFHSIFICSGRQICENLNGRDVALLESYSLWLELVGDLKPNSTFVAFGRTKTATKNGKGPERVEQMRGSGQRPTKGQWRFHEAMSKFPKTPPRQKAKLPVTKSKYGNFDEIEGGMLH